jgi:hypothetical protein
MTYSLPFDLVARISEDRLTVGYLASIIQIYHVENIEAAVT